MRRRKGGRHLELCFSFSRLCCSSITTGNPVFYNATCGLRRKIVQGKVVITTTPLGSCSISYTLPDWAQGNRKILTILFKTRAWPMQAGARGLRRVGIKCSKSLQESARSQSFHLIQEGFREFVKLLLTLITTPRKIKASLYFSLPQQLYGN